MWFCIHLTTTRWATWYLTRYRVNVWLNQEFGWMIPVHDPLCIDRILFHRLKSFRLLFIPPHYPSPAVSVRPSPWVDGPWTTILLPVLTVSGEIKVLTLNKSVDPKYFHLYYNIVPHDYIIKNFSVFLSFFSVSYSYVYENLKSSLKDTY